MPGSGVESETGRSVKGLSDERVRLAHGLQAEHGVAASRMAALLGLDEKQYLRRLGQLGLDLPPEGPPLVAPGALERLQAELRRLVEADELPDKARAEALMALARAVRTVDELAVEAARARPAEAGAGPAVELAAARRALQRIDRRIEHLAKKRAREILGGGLDAPASGDGGEGMAASGA